MQRTKALLVLGLLFVLFTVTPELAAIDFDQEPSAEDQAAFDNHKSAVEVCKQ